MREKDEWHRTNELQNPAVSRAYSALTFCCLKQMVLLALPTFTVLLVTDTGRSKLGVFAQQSMAPVVL